MSLCFKGTNKGQTLVETALVMPCVILILALLLQLILVVHMKMKLQRSASRIAHLMAMGQPSWKATAPELISYRKSLRWGFPVPNRFGGKLIPLEGIRAYPGPFSNEPRACMAVVDLSYALFGNWFAKVGIRPLYLRAHAEVPCEPVMGGRT